MVRKKTYLLAYFLFSLCFLFTVRGCLGFGNTTSINVSDKTKPVSIKESDYWGGGANPEVSAEMGGDGFNLIAESLGYGTNELKGDGSPDAVKGGRVVMHYSSYPNTLRTEGMESNSQTISFFGSLIYETILGFDGESMQWKPKLATHWKVSEDQQTFWYRIDPRARWADGMPVTVDDIISTHGLLIDDGINSASTNQQYSIYELKKISPYILKVKVADKNWRRFNSFSSIQVYPAHYFDKVTGAEYLNAYNFDMMPGTGPYLFDKTKLRLGSYITVVRRSDYWAEYNPNTQEFKHHEGYYNFDEIRVKIVTEARVALEKFKKGELDLYTMSRSQWWNEDFVYNLENPSYDKLYRGLIQIRKIFGHNPDGFGGICMNLRKWPFDNKSVRKAFDKLWDRKRLIEELFFNEYVQGDTYFPAGAYRDKGRVATAFDPEGALKLLDEAGYETNSEGWLSTTVYTCSENQISYSYSDDCMNSCKDKNCINETKILEFDFGMTQGSDRFLTIFQEDLQKVGIKMDIKFLSGSEIFKKVQNERDFDVYMGSWVGGYFPAPWYFFHSDNLIPGTVNFNGFSNANVDSLIDNYRSNFNIKERIEIIKQIDDILLDETLYLLTWQAPYSLRTLYWNKFGFPKHYIGYDGDWQSVFRLWWYDPSKADLLIDAQNNKEIILEKYDNGEINVYYDKIMGIE